MKIYIAYDNENHNIICAIYSLTYYIRKGKNEEQCVAAAEQRNKEAGWERFRFIEVPEQMEEVIDFLLGENQYKFYNDITAVKDELMDITGSMEEVNAELSDISSKMENIWSKLEKLENKQHGIQG